MTDHYDQLQVAAKALAEATGHERHDIAVVLGSGLNDYPDRLTNKIEVDYEDLPGFPIPTAIGHDGIAYSVPYGRNRVLLLAGRSHAYEGRSGEEIVFAVRTAIVAGCRVVVLTGAVGCCGEGMQAGDIAVVTDHINLTGFNVLTGENDERIGPRYVDMTDVYTPELQAKAHETAAQLGIKLVDGVYCGFLGPSFETPAEIRMAIAMGGTLVGMSTVPEATAARHMGSQVLGIAVCTNLAAGMSGARLSHQEVVTTAENASDNFNSLLDALLPRLRINRQTVTTWRR